MNDLKNGVELIGHQARVKDNFYGLDNSVLLYHGLGSGKTLSSIASSSGVTNIVVPASLRENYKKEISKFTDSGVNRNVYSYNYATKNKDISGDTLIVDEAHKIGNPGSKRSQAIRELATKHKRVMLMTGTPATNHPYELAPIIKSLNPDSDVPLNPSDFNKMFLSNKKQPIGIFKRLMGLRPGSSIDIKNEDKIKKYIKNKVDFYEPTKEHFPNRVDKTEKVEMSKEQVKYYNAITKKTNPALALKVRMNLPLTKKESADLNAFLSAARQISNTTKPFGGKEKFSPKINKVVDDFISMKSKNKRHKGVVFSNYLESGLNPIYDKLKEKGIKVEKFTGELNDREKRVVVDGYNKGDIDAILLSSAGAEGLDLKETRSVQVLEPHWNNNKIEQVIGRAIRYKSHENLPESQKKVNVYKYQSILPKTLVQKTLNKDRYTSSDEFLEEKSLEKTFLLNKFLNLFKEEGVK